MGRRAARAAVLAIFAWATILAPAKGAAPQAPAAETASSSCEDLDFPGSGEKSPVGILVAPEEPQAGQPIVILAATLDGESPLALRLGVAGRGSASAGATPLDAQTEVRPGIPSAVIARAETPSSAHSLIIGVERGGHELRCARVALAPSGGAPAVRGPDVWPTRRDWSGSEEALYAAWLRELSRAPRGEDLSYDRFDEMTSDPARNLLHDSLGLDEDRPPPQGLRLEPDCADTPYFFRAYFAWKRALPFAYRSCSRGSPGHAPTCGPAKPASLEVIGNGGLAAMQRYFDSALAWGVQSGNGRTALADDETDFYPLALARRALRPGAIYADPYGHMLVIAEWMPGEGGRPGVLYAIDGQPDGTITRKRFWEGSFLWNSDPGLGGSGFKGVRPLVPAGDAPGGVRSLGNREIATTTDYGDMSLEQARLGPGEFYDRMEALITPGRRDPLVAQEEAIAALSEQARARVQSVDNGEKHHAEHPEEIVAMPDGFEIFETSGAWEDFSTPARDLRLLIAMDVVRDFDAKVKRNRSAYGIENDAAWAQVQAALAADRERRLADPALGISYTRSDGSGADLTLAALLERAPALEVAYNPNDCPEVRWGAPAGSAETKGCARRAPEDQQRKMDAYRAWFHDRRRPQRGDAAP